ncbi:APC family permease [Streptomyces fuscigenes]|uniref:APC family permease n=1 Tax=Streptomyces fuscigenes TaxID=1528880 RepID=UPI001F2E4425|nr:APC family permease [Streptomyces fuscigenes]MCF3961821.1 APC family permease [Streptomyces fuscigenes]
MAVAGSAPAYTISATTAVLVGAVGLAGPASLLYSAVPMLGIVLAYGRLGRIDPSAGAAYSWVGRTLHPFLGFLSGWALVVSSTIFMVAGALPAGTLTLSLFDPALGERPWLAALVGAVWFLVMVAVVLGGVRLSIRTQFALTGIEVALLLAFLVPALVRGGGAGRDFDWRWLGLGGFDGPGGFAAGALIATFYFWGWDVTSNLSEESRNSRRTAGFAALCGAGVVFLLFETYTVAINMLLPPGRIEAGGADVLRVLGEAVWPGTGGRVLIAAVLLSTVATFETTLLQATRSLFAMGRDRTLPAALGRIHPRWNTPYAAVAVVGGVALVMLLAAGTFGSVTEVVSDAVTAISLQISVYYALAGLAAVVAYRKLLLTSVKEFLLSGVWPLFGSVFVLWMFFESLGRLSAVEATIGLGGLGLGLVPMLWYWRRGSSYYRPARLDASRSTVDLPSAGGPRYEDGTPYEDGAMATDF